MKPWKILIRIWLTLASLISFLIGWVVLAHAPKPNQFTASSVPAAPKLDPVLSLNQVMSSSGGQTQNFIQIRPVQRSPILRSGGS